MRTLFFIFALSLTLPFTPVYAATSVVSTADTSFAPATKHHKPLYEKGKGTIGFLCGLFLGPIGYFGVHAFSRNLKQRKRAKQGMITFGYVVATAALIWLMVVAAKAGNGPTINWPQTDNPHQSRKRAAVDFPVRQQRTIPDIAPINALPPDPQIHSALIP
ncbi:MAG TPA: hypothetical protein VNW04_08560 [Puia sp.]|jgi:hypothetical protein|nr:hypothetical protein [Puia sp.]